jgi:hypothetical protein
MSTEVRSLEIDGKANDILSPKENDKFCKYCKKTNHFIEDCWKLENKEKRNGKSSKRNISKDDDNVFVASEISNQDDVLIAFDGCVSIKD